MAIEERRYQSIFNSVAVSLWECDFSGLQGWLIDRELTDVKTLASYRRVHPNFDASVARCAHILDVNQATLLLFDAKEKARLLGSFADVMELGFGGVLEQTLTALVERYDTCQFELLVKTVAGRHRHVSVSIRLPRTSEGLRNVAVAMSDVTERVTLEHRMLAIQRMEAIGRLAGGVAHDFNNVLTVIQSYVSFLQERFESDAQALEDLNMIEGASQRAARLTNQLLAFSRRQVQRLQNINLNSVISTVERMLIRLLGEDITVRTSLAHELALVQADVSQIEQLLMNLAVNARDAMPDGGTLTITTMNFHLSSVYADQKRAEVPPGVWWTPIVGPKIAGYKL